MTDPREEFLDGLVSLGITESRVRGALAAVDRRRFVPDVPDDWVYEDGVLPDGVHHSQPLTVARLCALADVRPGDRVLEVGTGSGYQTAVLCHFEADSIVTIERDPEWAEIARGRLRDHREVLVVTGDGRLGYPSSAPYDVVIVNAAAPAPPVALLDQVASGGRLVMPIGGPGEQEWQVRERSLDGTWTRTSHGAVRFTDLV